MKLTDLKPWRLNPRTISEGRLLKLQNSYANFGDLSGVVFNKKTGVLVSGHQRLKVLKQFATTKIELHDVKDDLGTIQEGVIKAFEGKKLVLTVPMRVVFWSEKKVEMAANIAANAHGGDFDDDKLRKVLAQLEDGEFDIESLGLKYKLSKTEELPENGAAYDTGDDDDGEITASSIQTQHVCPKCKYRF